MYSLILPTYKNPKYLKLCINSILENSYYKTHQICVHVNGYDQESINYLKDKKINYTLSNDNIGISKAVNICIKTAIFDKVVFVNDDQYFSKNWDYNLHKWEIELKNKFPYYTYIIGYRMCEPTFGSFPPICDAGKTIDTFNINTLNNYIKEYSSHTTREEWLSCSLYPKDIVLNYVSNDFESKLCDIDFVMSTIKHFKDNNIKFLIFGVNDCLIYHFGSVVTKRLTKENVIEPNEISKFEDKWKINIDTAYNKILRNECKRSVKLIKEMIKDLKENEIFKCPTISTYISTTNALFYQSTLEQTIRQATLFSDEIIIVNSINSTDGTQNLLDNLKIEYPNIIKIYTYNEDYSKKWDTVTDKKTFALKKCTKDYCILQDDDECIHEKYINQIKQLPTQYPEALAFRFNTIHFYRSYDRYQNNPGWYQKKIYMIKNIETIKHGAVNTDLDNHVILQDNKYVPLDSLSNKFVIDTKVTSYHYGWARNDAILLMKKYVQDETWHGKEYWETHKFPFKFDNPTTLPEFKGTHPKYMIPIIEKEKQFNSMHIKDFEKENNKKTEKDIEKENVNLIDKYNFSDADGNLEGNVTNNVNNKIKITACILTRNEPTRIKDTILHVYPYVNEIIINDGSDTTSSIEEVKTIIDNEHKIKISHNPKQTTNFAEERNKMHELTQHDYVLHIDTDERFPQKFLKNMRNLVQQYLDKKEIPLRFRFSRRNNELDIVKDPDYQIRFLNRLYCKWERNVHEITTIIKKDEYYFHNEKMKIINSVSTNYVIDHLTKDRSLIRNRWDILSDESTDLSNIINRKLLICSMFKDSSRWINDVLLCIDNIIDHNNNVSNDNRLIIKLAFLKSQSDDNTINILDKYISSSQLKTWYEMYDEVPNEIQNVQNTQFNISRYKKLANLRNYLISESTKNIKLNDDDLILFMDSDIKFDKSIIHELIKDMKKSNADIMAPIVCIEDNGVFKNNYFYDTLAFRNIDNEQFSHFRPYIFGNIKRSKIKKETHKKIQKTLEKIDNLNILRKINWEFNLNTPLNDTFPENLYNEALTLIDLNIPIEVHSVGSFYLMKYKVAKNVKYSGNNDSEQVEFMNNARSKGYKIFVSQRLKVLHVNLEKYGLKWH